MIPFCEISNTELLLLYNALQAYIEAEQDSVPKLTTANRTHLLEKLSKHFGSAPAVFLHCLPDEVQRSSVPQFAKFRQGDPVYVIDGEYAGRKGEVVNDFGVGLSVRVGLEGRIYSQQIDRTQLELDPTPRVEYT